jgi:hypothetical protein
MDPHAFEICHLSAAWENSLAHSLRDPPDLAVKHALTRVFLGRTRCLERTASGEEEENGAHRLRNKGKELVVEREQVLEGQGRGGEAEWARPLGVSWL